MKRTVVLATMALFQLGAMAAEEGTLLFESTGTNCRNFAIVAKVDAKVARQMVPAKYALPRTVYGLVELASCDSGTVAGQSTGAFKIAEAAIMLPTPPGKKAFPLDGPTLYMLWLLDNNELQSASKVAAGYPGGVVDIQFEPPTTGLIRKMRAQIAYDGGYSLSGDDITLKINVGKKVTDQYVETPAGTVHTVNVIDSSVEGGFAIGSATFAEGSVLAKLFGKTKVWGLAFGGQGNYVNTTTLIPAP
ncbi:MAG TPA: hypothetical protein VFW84_03140 [Aquabacterium sp.]|uniref:hypothetical protein n=1 Tax=Aquabacterium sp. TaxID=1872578 RepID=UPI002E37E726|nr:hypothetical protein [Aquabacterium sp.]HEX5371709.1 hypothetical protein [Aquabacterium sp.]